MITNAIAFDWLTHSSTLSHGHTVVQGRLRDEWHTRTSEKWLQYSGYRCGQVFMGIATQNGHLHYITRISGDESEDHWRSLLGTSGKATRFDLQFTVPQKSWKAFALRGALVQLGVRARIYENSNGVDHTIYIGARESDILYRIYPKYDDENKLYVRVEIEFKGGLAAHYWNLMQKGEYTPAGIMEAELRFRILSKYHKENVMSTYIRDYIQAPLFSMTREGTEKSRPKRKKEQNRLKWLRGPVASSVQKLAQENPEAAQQYVKELDALVTNVINLTGALQSEPSHSASSAPEK